MGLHRNSVFCNGPAKQVENTPPSICPRAPPQEAECMARRPHRSIKSIPSGFKMSPQMLFGRIKPTQIAQKSCPERHQQNPNRMKKHTHKKSRFPRHLRSQGFQGGSPRRSRGRPGQHGSSHFNRRSIRMEGPAQPNLMGKDGSSNSPLPDSHGGHTDVLG